MSIGHHRWKYEIDVYFARSEQAVRETEQKYGSFCHRIVMKILGIQEDAGECVNDSTGAGTEELKVNNHKKPIQILKGYPVKKIGYPL